jgi:hypothetical protein
VKGSNIRDIGCRSVDAPVDRRRGSIDCEVRTLPRYLDQEYKTGMDECEWYNRVFEHPMDLGLFIWNVVSVQIE